MRFILIIPTFLAYATILSRFFFSASERRAQRLALLAVGIVLAAGFYFYAVGTTARNSGFISVRPHGTFWRHVWTDMQWLPTQIDLALAGMLGPNGIILATVTLFLLPIIGVILYLLHKNSADPR